MVTKQRKNAKPGDLFAIQLPNHLWTVLLVSRITPVFPVSIRRWGLVGFGRTWKDCPRIEECQGLTPEEIVYLTTDWINSTHGLTWPALGSLEGYSRAGWPWPPFLNGDLAWTTQYERVRARAGKDVADRNFPKPDGTHYFQFQEWVENPTDSDRLDFNDHHFIEPTERRLFPLNRVSWLETLPVGLEEAIRDPKSPLRFQVTAEHLAVWRRVLKKARDKFKLKGIYLPGDPEPPLEPKPMPRRKVDLSDPRTQRPVDMWAVIDAARAAKPKTQKAFLKACQKELAGLTVEQLRDFKRQVRAAVKAANTWDLWCAAYLLNGGCSDDGFEYFREWLVAQGRAVYDAAIKNPDSLATATLTLGKPGEFELEGLEMVPAEVYSAECDGYCPDNLTSSSFPPQPKGKRWDEDDEVELKRRVPNLYAKYGER